jgi:hypothetical protein
MSLKLVIIMFLSTLAYADTWNASNGIKKLNTQTGQYDWSLPASTATGVTQFSQLTDSNTVLTPYLTTSSATATYQYKGDYALNRDTYPMSSISISTGQVVNYGVGIGGGSSIYPATSTASFPFGASFSTTTVNQSINLPYSASISVSTGTSIYIQEGAAGYAVSCSTNIGYNRSVPLSSYNIGYDTFTVSYECWFKPSLPLASYPAGAILSPMFCEESANPSWLGYFTVTMPGTLGYFIAPSSYKTQAITLLQNWNYVCFSWDLKTGIAFVNFNGTITSFTGYFSVAGGFGNGRSATLDIGGRYNVPSWSYPCTVDEVRIYSTAISTTTSMNHFNGGSGTYGSNTEPNIMHGWHFDDESQTAGNFVVSTATINMLTTPYISGIVSPGQVNKNILQRVSGNPNSGPGVINIGYTGDSVCGLIDLGASLGNITNKWNTLYCATVGIGTISPGSSLSVNGGSSIGATYNVFNPGIGKLIVENGIGIGTTAPDQKLSVIGNIDTSGVIISSGTGNNIFQGNIKLTTAGNGIYISTGTNSTMGSVTLVGGTATVNTTKVTANSIILLTVQGGALTNLGSEYISARSVGTSFTITSTNILDVSTVGWIILEALP